MQTACFRGSYTPASLPRNASAIRPLTSIPGHTSAKLSLRELIYTPFIVIWTHHWSTLPRHRYLGTPLLHVPHTDTWSLPCLRNVAMTSSQRRHDVVTTFCATRVAALRTGSLYTLYIVTGQCLCSTLPVGKLTTRHIPCTLTLH